MKWIRMSRRVAGSALAVCLGTGVLLNQAHAQQTSGTVTIERLPAGVEVLMRGPVHQAFAQPYPNNEEMVTVERPVPAPLHERPAAARPSDPERTAQWIPGYWAVDPESQDLLWVSGIWRFPPPGRQWIPGYWDTRSSASTWISGFWIDERIEELEFVSRPPEPKETIPANEPPSPNHFWAPGYWYHDRGEFVWEPGSWSEAQQGWVWEPARYLQTPNGWVFVDGYWDYEPSERGLLFAPVRFDRARIQVTQEVRRPVLLQETYWPQVAIEPRQAMVHWFARPAYTHYYFGNYYGSTFAQRGLVPWAGYQQQPTYYDPLFWYFRAAQPTLLNQWVQTRNRVIAQPALQPAAVFNTDIASAQLPSYVQTIDNLLSGERANRYTRVEANVLDEYSERLQEYDTFTNERLTLRARLGDEAAARVQTEERQPGEQRTDRDARRGDRPGQRAGTDTPSDTDQPRDQARDSQDRRMQARDGEPQRDPADRPDEPTPDRPDSDPDRPRTKPDRPGTTPDRPGTTPAQPGTAPDRPRTMPDRPGAAPDRPGATPDQPGTTPDQPGTMPERPERPGTMPERPERPGTAPDQPGATPERPGATPERPGATPGRPGATPERPGAAPERPGSTPERPGAATADRPVTPGTPTPAGDRPAEMRQDPRSGDRARPDATPGDRRRGAAADPRLGAPANPRGTIDRPGTPATPGAATPGALDGPAGTRGSAQTQGTVETRALSETAGTTESRGTAAMRGLAETSGAGNRGGLPAVTSGAARGPVPGATGELPSELLQRRRAEQAVQGLTPGQRMSLNRLRSIQMPDGLPRAQGVPNGQQPRFAPPPRIGRPGLMPSPGAAGRGILEGASPGVPEGQTPPDI